MYVIENITYLCYDSGKDYGYLVVVNGEGKTPELQYTSDKKEIPREAYFEIHSSHEED
jgi:hypothetical protein